RRQRNPSAGLSQCAFFSHSSRHLLCGLAGTRVAVESLVCPTRSDGGADSAAAGGTPERAGFDPGWLDRHVCHGGLGHVAATALVFDDLWRPGGHGATFTGSGPGHRGGCLVAETIAPRRPGHATGLERSRQPPLSLYH